MKIKWRTFLLILYLIVIGIIYFVANNKNNYFYVFNPERLKIGLVAIDSSWMETWDSNKKHHSWTNKSKNIPRYYVKYLQFNNWMNSITNEYDSYLIKIDDKIVIVSIEYDYKNKSFTYTLDDYNIKEKGRLGKLIKTLNKNELLHILEKNGIQYSNIK